MTLELHFRREQSWLLWLPLLLAVCLLPGIIAELNSSAYYTLAMARGIVLVISVLLIHGIGFRQLGNWGIRYAKEFRSQYRGALLAIFIPSLLAIFTDLNLTGFVQILGMLYVIGCATLGATAFGIEFEHRTIGALLAQPVSRWVLLAEKLVPLAVLLALSFVQAILSALIHTLPRSSWTELHFPVEFGEFLLLAVIPPVFAFCTGPALTLLTRRTLAAAVFTIALPPILALAVVITCSILYKFLYAVEHGQNFFDVIPPDRVPGFVPFLASLPPLYLFAGLIGGGVLFHRLGWKESMAQAPGSGIHPLAVPLDRLFKAALGRGRIAALIRKELRLHPAPFLVAMLGTGLWLLWRWANLLNPQEFPLDSDIGLAAVMIMGSLVAILAGAGCVAEERQLGTLDWQLTQPASIRQQWSIKLGVAFCVAALLGGVLPIALARFGLAQTAFSKSTDDMLGFFSALPLLFAVAVYASSVCRNAVNAAVMSLPVAGTIIMLGLIPAMAVFVPGYIQGAEGSGAQMLTIYGLTLLPAVVVLLFWTAGSNFKCSVVNAGRVVRQICMLSLGVVILSSVVSIALLAIHTLNNIAHHPHHEDAQQAINLPSDSEPVPPIPNNSLAIEGTANPASAPAFKMDPVLVHRYGLIPAKAIPVTTPSSPNANAAFKMDPVLMKRYGLSPALPSSQK